MKPNSWRHAAGLGLAIASRCLRRRTDPPADHRTTDFDTAARAAWHGWRTAHVAKRQDEVAESLLRELARGQPRVDLVTGAEAVRLTGLTSPSVLEIGCGTGHYQAVFHTLLEQPVSYVGLDYSLPMIELAARRYASPFVVGDAASLPFVDAAFDVVFNGTALMHVLRYADAIRESRRVARRWCVFHTVPVMRTRPTTMLRKLAYGEPTAEVILNEDELLGLIRQNGLQVRHVLDSIPYDLRHIVGESTSTKTYVCVCLH